MPSKSYHERQIEINTLKIRQLLKNLPDFVAEYLRGISTTTLVRTRLAYVRDISLFLEFLAFETSIVGSDFCVEYFTVLEKMEGGTAIEETFAELELARKTAVMAVSTEDINKIDANILEKYMEHISVYKVMQKNGNYRNFSNANSAKARKLAAVRSMLKYFFRKGLIESNPGELVLQPKVREKDIVRLEVDEIAALLDMVECGEKLTASERRSHAYTKERDLAILSVLLGTGIRVTECVGLNLDDLDFDVNGFRVTRKGGNEQVIYFSNEVEAALKGYLSEREQMTAKQGHENALFLSLQKSRLTVRAVQNMVRKYSKKITNLKNISPHKLRSSFATNLYRETFDINLVADVLGHSDVNTTKKHYAHLDDERKRSAARKIQLR